MALKTARFDSDDRIEPGIVSGRTVEHFHPDHDFLELLAIALNGFLNGETEKSRHALRARKDGAFEYAGDLPANRGRRKDFGIVGENQGFP